MVQVCGKQIQYNKNGFTMLEISYDFDKRLKYLGND